jgi:hypothetical protein
VPASPLAAVWDSVRLVVELPLSLAVFARFLAHTIALGVAVEVRGESPPPHAEGVYRVTLRPAIEGIPILGDVDWWCRAGSVVAGLLLLLYGVRSPFVAESAVLAGVLYANVAWLLADPLAGVAYRVTTDTNGATDT